LIGKILGHNSPTQTTLFLVNKYALPELNRLQYLEKLEKEGQLQGDQDV
jgi:hypothetical protein